MLRPMYEIGVTVVVLLLVVGLLGASLADTIARRIAAAIDGWAAQGVISADQAKAIRDRYARLIGDDSRLRVAQALGVLGIAVVGLGVILFFAANWDEIPRFLRLAMLIVGMLGCYLAGGWLLANRPGSTAAGQALIALGTILFGASLFLVGQMYNVRAHDPLAFLIWSAGAASVGFLVRSAALAGLATLTFYAWFIFELVSLTSQEYEVETFIPVLLGLLGAALYALATFAKPWLDPFRFSGPIRTVGFASLAIGTLVFTFPEAHQFEAAEEALRHDFISISMWTQIVATWVGAAALIVLGRRYRRTALWEGLVLASVPALFLLLVYGGEERRAFFLGDDEQGKIVLYPLLFIALMVILVVGAALVGHVNGERWLTNAGILFASSTIVGRFLDPYWDMLPRSFFFLGAGVAVLALAWLLERRRIRTVLE